MTVKRKDLRTPQSYSEAFDILGDNGVLYRKFSFSFAKIAEFRNFIAHDDDDTIDAAVICGNILAGLGDIRAYVQQIRIGCGIK